ncbi:unnamed protein product [Sphagnum jensenii]|uniref:Uncharacterized protein n=1 Tax=Sphagnum jensenii TaxID=128206 RepID=A0ABP0WXG3_9BRYO
MAGTSGGGFGSRGGDNNEERLRKMVADHLRASELFAIDTRTPEGLASLTAILGQALQAGLTAGEAQREEEARKAAEAKAVEKKRKKDERATTGALSPRTLEKKRRKDERDAIRKEKLDLKKKEEERKKLPLITLAEEGIPTELAYTGAKSTIRHIVSTNFARGVEWGTLSKAEQERVINQVKGAFRNGGELDSQWIVDKISNSMSQARYRDRMKIRTHLRDLNVYRNLERPLQFSEDIWNAFYQSEVQLKAARQLKEIIEQLAKAKKARELGRSDRDLKALEVKLAECQSVVDEVGDPPLKFLKAAERVKLVPPTTHRLGQGGIPGLKAAFYKRYKRKITAAEMTMGQEHGKEHLFEHVDALLASEGESESSQGSSDEEERGPSTTPSATISSGPCSITSRNASFVGGKDKEDREEEEEEEEEGQGDDDEREEDEQPPPPPENTRKKHSRKKSKRGRKSR